MFLRLWLFCTFEWNFWSARIGSGRIIETCVTSALLAEPRVGHPSVHALFSYHHVFVALWNVMLCLHAGPKIEHKTEDVEGEDKGHDPLENRGGIPVVGPGCAYKDDSEDDLSEDESELDPEADSQDSVMTIMNAEPLIFGAEEDGGNDVADDENEQTAIVDGVVAIRVENRQNDQTGGSGDGKDQTADAEDFLCVRCVSGKTTPMSQPSFSEKAQIEKDDCDDTAGDEERFQAECSHVRDIGKVLPSFHRWKMFVW